MEITQLINYIIKKIINYSSLEQRVLRELKPTKDPFIVIAFGKGAEPMARAAVSKLDNIEGGVVVVPEWMEARRIEGLELVKSSHPVPSEASLRAGEIVLEWASKPGRSKILVLISGGGSALVEVLQEGLELEDIIEANKLLLSSGANIHEINAVRKHLSLIKGGWLAKHAHPKNLLALYASDVPGDRLDSIASGPTVPDPTTYNEALQIIERYNLSQKMPERVIMVLQEGAEGKRPETPKPGDKIFNKVKNKLIAANIDVLKSLQEDLGQLGLNTLILTSRLDGDSIEVGKALASIALEAATRGFPLKPPGVILLGGETSVRLTSNRVGMGGRNQELVLSWLANVDRWMFQVEDRVLAIVAMDTDGIDGSSPAAGAYAIIGDTSLLRKHGYDPWKVLSVHDSYRALKSIGRTIETGPLPSNLNSIITIIIL